MSFGHKNDDSGSGHVRGVRNSKITEGPSSTLVTRTAEKLWGLSRNDDTLPSVQQKLYTLHSMFRDRQMICVPYAQTSQGSWNNLIGSDARWLRFPLTTPVSTRQKILLRKRFLFSIRKCRKQVHLPLKAREPAFGNCNHYSLGIVPLLVCWNIATAVSSICSVNVNKTRRLVFVPMIWIWELQRLFFDGIDPIAILNFLSGFVKNKISNGHQRCEHALCSKHFKGKSRSPFSRIQKHSIIHCILLLVGVRKILSFHIRYGHRRPERKKWSSTTWKYYRVKQNLSLAHGKTLVYRCGNAFYSEDIILTLYILVSFRISDHFYQRNWGTWQQESKFWTGYPHSTKKTPTMIVSRNPS